VTDRDSLASEWIDEDRRVGCDLMSDIASLVRLEYADPHRLLGRHVEGGELVFRAFRPDAAKMEVIWNEHTEPMDRVRDEGIFELRRPVSGQESGPPPGAYQLRASGEGWGHTAHDPYAFAPTVGELDLHLMGEGKHHELHRVLGARTLTHQGVDGTSFSVWAPDARRVSVVGELNQWDGHRHMMRRLSSGIWELFIPGIGDGELYKFEILSQAGDILMKADPLAREMELRPSTASRVFTSHYRWGDEAWMERRAKADPASGPMAIYEVHLGSWRHHPGPQRHAGRPNWLSYRELAEQLVPYVSELGFTHIEVMPVMEHPFDGSWGYQVGNYFAPTSRYGSPDDLRHLIDACHRAGIGVIFDWVPAHFPKDAYALGRFDGSALYEHLDPRQGEHRQWGTYVFNYGRHEVSNFLIANALYWLEDLHVDGLRADAVASMLYLDYAAQREEDWQPNPYGGRENIEAVAFLRELNDVVRARVPGAVVIAEESTAWPGVTHATETGGLGFSFKWNMGWMHDTLRYFSKDPIHRSFHHNSLTFGLMYAFSERFVLPLSHDEVVHMKGSMLAKMAGDRWRKFANLRSLYAHMWAHPGKKLLFMGGEIGQWTEWSESRALDWEVLGGHEHVGLSRLVGDLNRVYRETPALYEADAEPRGFRWIDCNDHQQSVISYLRYPKEPTSPSDYVVCVGNFTPVPRIGYRIGVPVDEEHREIINTDADVYGGSGMGNMGATRAQNVPAHGFAHSLELTLPPLSVLWLRPASACSGP
jgi:1,4-alpha-glucan branching enzyme